MKVTPIQSLHRFLDLPRKTAAQHLKHQATCKNTTKEFEEKLCATFAVRKTTTVLYTADGKLKAI